MSGKIKKINDKSGLHGHKATFLTLDDSNFISHEDLALINKDLILSKEDQEILDTIILSLSNNSSLPFTCTPQETHFIKNNTPNCVAKYLIYRYKFKIYPKERIVASAPLHLIIEPTSVCNLRCIMCFQQDKSFRSKEHMGEMSLDLFKKIIDETSDIGVYALTLGTRGEPFLNKNLVKFLEYASNKNTFFDIKLVTNGTKMTSEDIHGVFNAGINIIQFSIDACDKDLYERIRVRGDFDIVLSNIKKTVKIREKYYPDSKAEIRVSGVKFLDEQDADRFNEFWSKIVDVVVLVRPQERVNTYSNVVASHHEPCDFLWERLNIWHNGVVNPCDEDYKSMLSPGKFPDSSIKNIWLGDNMNKMRNMHINDERIRLNPCDKCGV